MRRRERCARYSAPADACEGTRRLRRVRLRASGTFLRVLRYVEMGVESIRCGRCTADSGEAAYSRDG